MRIQCGLQDIITENYIRVAGLRVQVRNQNASIPPGETIQYICPFDKFFLGKGEVRTAEIILLAEFKTLGMERNTDSEIFNWSHISHQWIEGQIIK